MRIVLFIKDSDFYVEIEWTEQKLPKKGDYILLKEFILERGDKKLNVAGIISLKPWGARRKQFADLKTYSIAQQKANELLKEPDGRYTFISERIWRKHDTKIYLCYIITPTTEKKIELSDNEEEV